VLLIVIADLIILQGKENNEAKFEAFSGKGQVLKKKPSKK